MLLRLGVCQGGLEGRVDKSLLLTMQAMYHSFFVLYLMLARWWTTSYNRPTSAMTRLIRQMMSSDAETDFKLITEHFVLLL